MIENNYEDKINSTIEEDNIYLNEKLKPLIQSLLNSIIANKPESISYYIIQWLKSFKGYKNNLEDSTERQELFSLRKEIKRLKAKYQDLVYDNEALVSSDSNSSDYYSEEDYNNNNNNNTEYNRYNLSNIYNNSLVDPINIKLIDKAKSKGPRSSVSAEVYGIYNKKIEFKPIIIEKTIDQITRLREQVLKSFLFSNLDTKEISTVINAMKECNYKKDENVIVQGESGNNLFVVEKGILECFKKTEIETKFIREYYPGDFFGELALLYNSPRAATIICKNDCVLWSLDRETFNSIIKESSINKRDKYFQFLKSVNIFKSFDNYDILHICDALKQKTYSKGDYIIKQNDIGDELFLIKEGNAKATLNNMFKSQSSNISNKDNFNNNQIEVKRYEKGDYFGELALIKNEPRAANVIAISEYCTVLSLDRKTFKRLLGSLEDILKKNSQKFMYYKKN